MAKCVGDVCGGPIGQHTSVPRNHDVGHLKAGMVHIQGSGSDLQGRHTPVLSPQCPAAPPHFSPHSQHYRDTMAFSIHLMELGRQGSNPRSAIYVLCDLRQVTPPLCAFIFVYKKGIIIFTSLDYGGALMKHTPGIYRCAENVSSSTSSHSVSFSDFTLPYLF